MTVGGRGTEDDVSFITWASGQRSPRGGKQGSIQGSCYPGCIGNDMRWSLLAVSGWKARAYRGSVREERRREERIIRQRRNLQKRTRWKALPLCNRFRFWTWDRYVSRRKATFSYLHTDYWNFPPKINIQMQQSKLIHRLAQRKHNAIFITCLPLAQHHQNYTLTMPLASPNNHAHLNPQHTHTDTQSRVKHNTALPLYSKCKSDNNGCFSWMIEGGVLTSSYLSFRLQLSLSLSVSYPLHSAAVSLLM